MYSWSISIIHFTPVLLFGGILICLPLGQLTSVHLLLAVTKSLTGWWQDLSRLRLRAQTNLSGYCSIPLTARQSSIQHYSSQIESGKKQYSLKKIVVRSLPNLMN